MGSKFLLLLGLSVAIVLLLISSDVAARDAVEPVADKQNAEAAVGKPAEPGKNEWLNSFAEQVKNEKGKTEETSGKEGGDEGEEGKEGEEEKKEGKKGEEAQKGEEGEKEEEEEKEEKGEKEEEEDDDDD